MNVIIFILFFSITEYYSNAEKLYVKNNLLTIFYLLDFLNFIISSKIIDIGYMYYEKFNILIILKF